jgi:ABC-type Fe3+/spermidine/putrescine transport system ATPase subunit
MHCRNATEAALTLTLVLIGAFSVVKTTVEDRTYPHRIESIVQTALEYLKIARLKMNCRYSSISRKRRKRIAKKRACKQTPQALLVT